MKPVEGFIPLNETSVVVDGFTPQSAAFLSETTTDSTVPCRSFAGLSAPLAYGSATIVQPVVGATTVSESFSCLALPASSALVPQPASKASADATANSLSI